MITAYQILWFFLIYAFLGWCIEVAWCGIGEGHFINRGFLNGPVCPIYGVGGVSVILCLTPIKNTVVLFFASMIITSVLELITGIALEKIYHTRWWDYSDIPFNIGGYICLKYSIYWGFVCIALMKGIHPLVLDIVNLIPRFLGTILLIFLFAVFISDIVVTILTINKLSNRIKLMDELAAKIHAVSDDIGEHIYDKAASAVKKGEEILESEKVREIIAEREKSRAKHEQNIAELKEKYAYLADNKNIFQNRILKAFPNIHSHRHFEQLEKLKKKHK